MRPAPLPVILGSALLGSTAFALFNLGSVFWLQDRFGASGMEVGLFAAAASLAYAAGCWFFRAFHGRVAAEVEVAVVCLLLSATFLGACFAPNLGVAFGINAIQGFLMSFFWPPLMAWAVSGRSGRDLARILGWYNLSWISAVVAGPLVSAWLSQMSPERPLQAASASFFLLFLIGLPRALRASVPSRSEGVAAGDTVAADPARKARVLSWIGSVTFHLLIGVVLNLVPVWGREGAGFGKTDIGLLLFFRAGATALTFLVLSRLSFWHRNVTSLLLLQVVGALFLCACFLLPSFPTVPVQGVALAILGVLVAASYVFSIHHSADGSPNASLGMALHELFLTLGMLAGAAVGGWIYRSAGMAHVWAFIGVSLLLGLGAQLIAARRLSTPPV